ncbi:unnamed protein product [Lactuca saligna]|uniref:Uncharacterized protein n=1 Tax=Lactuca saligna TaxID=75948 RepID=A0AA36E414_LACSI|nr:unnamed protein product [Lactuca saligna]
MLEAREAAKAIVLPVHCRSCFRPHPLTASHEPNHHRAHVAQGVPKSLRTFRSSSRSGIGRWSRYGRRCVPSDYCHLRVRTRVEINRLMTSHIVVPCQGRRSLELSEAEGVHSKPSCTISCLPLREARVLWHAFVGLERWTKPSDLVNLLRTRR